MNPALTVLSICLFLPLQGCATALYVAARGGVRRLDRALWIAVGWTGL
jgi:hypothetical protein